MLVTQFRVTDEAGTYLCAVRAIVFCKVLLPISSLVVHKIYCTTLGNVARVYPWIIQGLTFLAA